MQSCQRTYKYTGTPCTPSRYKHPHITRYPQVSCTCAIANAVVSVGTAPVLALAAVLVPNRQSRSRARSEHCLTIRTGRGVPPNSQLARVSTLPPKKKKDRPASNQPSFDNNPRIVGSRFSPPPHSAAFSKGLFFFFVCFIFPFIYCCCRDVYDHSCFPLIIISFSRKLWPGDRSRASSRRRRHSTRARRRRIRRLRAPRRMDSRVRIERRESCRMN